MHTGPPTRCRESGEGPGGVYGDAVVQSVSAETRRSVVFTLLVKGVRDLEGLAYVPDTQIVGWEMVEAVRIIVNKAKSVAVGVVEAAVCARIRRVCEAAGVRMPKRISSSMSICTSKKSQTPASCRQKKNKLTACQRQMSGT